MATNEDLKHMITNFRVSELQVLLGFAGRNKTGRKHELQQRTLALLEKGCSTPIQIKIKELYRRRFPRRMVVPPGPPSYLSHLMSDQSKTSQYAPPVAQIPPQSPSSGLGHNTLASHGFTRTSKADIHGLPPHHMPSQVVHPDVILKSLPFFDILAELVKPTSLVDPGGSKFRDSQRTLLFHLTPSQIQQIVQSDIRPMGGNTVQVQLRFCLAETSCEQDDRIPTSLTVKVNGKICSLPPCYPQNKPGVEAKRPSRPLNVTNLTRLSAAVTNQIDIQWIPEIARSYCAAVYLVHQLTSETLLSRLRAKGIRNPDHSRALIKEKLTHDPDSEIATTSLRVSLICPLGKMRMTLPCRAMTCTHLQCFDASLYIQMNERKPTWICPVCDKKASFAQLVIDGLFLEILKTPPDSNEIQFLEDGSWRPMEQETKSDLNFLSHSGPSTPRAAAAGAAPPVTTPVITDAASPEPEDDDVILIDLTESDEEGDVRDSDSDSDADDSSSGSRRKSVEAAVAAIDRDLENEIQRDLLQTPPVDVNQHSPNRSTHSGTPISVSESSSRLVTPESPRPSTSSRSPLMRSNRLEDILDFELSKLQEPDSNKSRYSELPMERTRHQPYPLPSQLPSRAILGHSSHSSMHTPLDLTAPHPPLPMLPDYYYPPPPPVSNHNDLSDLISLLQPDYPLQPPLSFMDPVPTSRGSSVNQRSPGLGPPDVIPLD